MNAPLRIRHKPPTGRPWTAEEEAILAKLTRPSRRRARFDWSAVLLALPGRTRAACHRRRELMGLRSAAGGRRWTVREDKVIRDDFAEDGRRTLLTKLPGRSWRAICRRAQQLGFPPKPQGWEHLQPAIERAGWGRGCGQNVVAWANFWAPIVSALCGAFQGLARLADAAPAWAPGVFDGGGIPLRKHTTCSTNNRSDFDTSHCQTLAEEGAADAAARRWLSWESIPDAAARTGASPAVVFNALIRERYIAPGPRRVHRVHPAWVDDALARRRRPGQTRRAERLAAQKAAA